MKLKDFKVIVEYIYTAQSKKECIKLMDEDGLFNSVRDYSVEEVESNE